MKVTILRFDIGTAVKVGFALSIAGFAIAGLFALVGQVFLRDILNSIYLHTGDGDISLFKIPRIALPLLCIGYVIGTLGAGIAGGIGLGLCAVLYNFVARMMGGLQVQLSKEIQ